MMAGDAPGTGFALVHRYIETLGNVAGGKSSGLGTTVFTVPHRSRTYHALALSAAPLA